MLMYIPSVCPRKALRTQTSSGANVFIFLLFFSQDGPFPAEASASQTGPGREPRGAVVALRVRANTAPTLLPFAAKTAASPTLLLPDPKLPPALTETAVAAATTPAEDGIFFTNKLPRERAIGDGSVAATAAAVATGGQVVVTRVVTGDDAKVDAGENLNCSSVGKRSAGGKGQRAACGDGDGGKQLALSLRPLAGRCCLEGCGKVGHGLVCVRSRQESVEAEEF